MSDIALELRDLPAPARRGLLRRSAVGLAKAATVVLIGVMLGFAALVAFLDTGPGHRFIVDRIAAMIAELGLAHPHRPDRRFDLGQHPIEGRAALRSRRPVRRIARDRDGLAADRFPLGTAGDPRARFRSRHPPPHAAADPAGGAAADPARLRHAYRPARCPPAADRRADHRTRADRQPARRGRNPQRPRADRAGRPNPRRRRPVVRAPRRRARPRPLRSRGASPGPGQRRRRGDARHPPAGPARRYRRRHLGALGRPGAARRFRDGRPPISA